MSVGDFGNGDVHDGDGDDWRSTPPGFPTFLRGLSLRRLGDLESASETLSGSTTVPEGTIEPVGKTWTAWISPHPPSPFSTPAMSDSARPAKRRRAVVACNSCRHRKSRVRVSTESFVRCALIDSSVMGPSRAPSARSCNAIVFTKMLGHLAT